jgi:two-component sensor histidine kinase
MMQGRMDNERREQQYKNEVEQREREYQLRREEMALAHEEACEQRQMMNLMFMTMLNKNAGSDSNSHPPSPRNT